MPKKGQKYIGKPKLNTYQYNQKQDKILRTSKAKGKTLEKQIQSIEKKKKEYAQRWEIRKQYTSEKNKLKKSKSDLYKKTHQTIINKIVLKEKERRFDISPKQKGTKGFKRDDKYIIQKFVAPPNKNRAKFLSENINKNIPFNYIMIVMFFEGEDSKGNKFPFTQSISIPNTIQNIDEYIKESYNKIIDEFQTNYGKFDNLKMLSYHIEYTPPKNENSRQYTKFQNLKKSNTKN